MKRHKLEMHKVLTCAIHINAPGNYSDKVNCRRAAHQHGARHLLSILAEHFLLDCLSYGNDLQRPKSSIFRLGRCTRSHYVYVVCSCCPFMLQAVGCWLLLAAADLRCGRLASDLMELVVQQVSRAWAANFPFTFRLQLEQRPEKMQVLGSMCH